MTTHTLDQPFARINTPHPCTESGRHAPQIVPVVGNADRATHVFVVQHGREYLTLDGELTSTPVWLTWGEAERAEQSHADRRRPTTEDREFYDQLHDSIPSDVPATVWESDAASKGAGA